MILKRHAGMESKLELEIGMTSLAVRVSLWYTGKLVSVKTLTASACTVQKELAQFRKSTTFSTTFQAGKWWSLQHHCCARIDSFKALTFLFPQCL